MLTADLVNARRRGDELRLVSLDARTRLRATTLAESLVLLVRAHVGRPREELAAAIASLDVGARERRLRDGLAKLVEDRCTFDAEGALEPESLRRTVFGRAAALRASLQAGEHLDRAVVLADVAREMHTSAEVVERALFADLRGAHVLTTFDAPTAETLVAEYERGQAQAVLLRAVKIEVDVRCASPAALRSFFQRLKFLRLLYVIRKNTERGETDRRSGGPHAYRVVIDGPFSLFESVTKYGLKLALLLPALEECERFELTADVRWGATRTPLVFRLQGGHAAAHEVLDSPLPDDIEAFVRSFRALDTSWTVRRSSAMLDLPGVGLTVPDLVFERTTSDGKRERVYFEVMGYWSRAAVWRRVELVQAGLTDRIIFAVSSRLRVSEDVLEGDLPGALYVYKGAMSARAVQERLDRPSSPQKKDA